jgi:hypothetical protein
VRGVRQHHHLLFDLMGLKTFPKESLIPSQALVRRDRGGYDIRINLQPFTLDNESIETAFCLDGVQLPEDKQAWANQTFTFPLNLNDGYIDESRRSLPHVATLSKVLAIEGYAACQNSLNLPTAFES